MMKNKDFFFLLMTSLLAACSTGPPAAANLPPQPTDPVPQTQPTATSALSATQPLVTAPVVPTGTPTSKPPLAPYAWKQMPVAPGEISYAMKAVRVNRLSLGIDPTHHSIIGDCQNVSSYFLSVY